MLQKDEPSPKIISFTKRYRFPLRLLFIIGYIATMDFLFSVINNRIVGDSFIHRLIFFGFGLCMFLVLVVGAVILFDPLLRKNQEDISK